MTATDTNTPGEKLILVHKRDAEGALQINALDGMIRTPLDERPEWAEGLAMALTGERLSFYDQRLGTLFTDAHKQPEAIAFEDLGWIGADAEGDAVELSADAEHRMEVLAEAMGVNRIDDLSNEQLIHLPGKGKVLAEVEMNLDKSRTDEEHAAFTASQDEMTRTGTK